MNVLDWVSAVTIFGGVFVVLAGSVGVLRLPEFYTRLHAASSLDTLGAGLILGGLILQAGFGLLAFKLFLIYAFLLFTSPVATHALARTAMKDGVVPPSHDLQATASVSQLKDRGRNRK